MFFRIPRIGRHYSHPSAEYAPAWTPEGARGLGNGMEAESDLKHNLGHF